ncbi:MAG TPA: hypothetical protein ENH91_03725 [Leeuwenhoekiella sp.]|nr:hypothetical protein [Leeuwenhoekiella sp.]
MFTFGTSSGTGNTINGTSTVQNLDGNVPEPGQSLVPSYKHKTKENLNKQPNVIFNEFEVLKFFEKNNWPEIEGRKFYAYNRLKKFILKDGKTKINWQTAAVIFFKNGFKIKNPDQTSPISGYLENLKCKGNGRYD